jgi:hypothetical protein
MKPLDKRDEWFRQRNHGNRVDLIPDQIYVIDKPARQGGNPLFVLALSCPRLQVG